MSECDSIVLCLFIHYTFLYVREKPYPCAHTVTACGASFSLTWPSLCYVTQLTSGKRLSAIKS